MEKERSAITFKARYYEVILEGGSVSFMDVNSNGPEVRITSTGKKIRKLDAARKLVMKYLLRRPDPAMTFSD